jgi:hypothetical protein
MLRLHIACERDVGYELIVELELGLDLKIRIKTS